MYISRFDSFTGTPIDVAMEMVKELDIAVWEPSEVANMIEGYIHAAAR